MELVVFKKGIKEKKAEIENTVHNEAPALTENTPKETLTPEELRRQKRREYLREYYRKNKGKICVQQRENYLRNRDRELTKAREYYQKNRERICTKFKERYHSDPKYREEYLNMRKMWREKNREKMKYYNEERREALVKLKIALGGKCTVCGNDDLDVLVPHHPNGKGEKGRCFTNTKEFRDWVRYGIILKVVLMCANHHLKFETAKARGEVVDIADFLKKA